MNILLPGWWDKLELGLYDQLEYAWYNPDDPLADKNGWVEYPLDVVMSPFYKSSNGKQKADISGEIDAH